MYTPDLWVLVKLTLDDKVNYRVLGSWYGGYLGNDSWRMSSGITEYEDVGHVYLFKNRSGSIYTCSKTGVGMSSLATMALMNLQKQGAETNVKLEVIDINQFLDEFKGESDDEA
jgi:hypothetical protein